MKGLHIVLFLFIFSSVYGQLGRVEKNDRAARLIDRYEIKYGHFQGHTNTFPVYKDEVYTYFMALDSVGLLADEEYDRLMVLNMFQEFTPYEEKEAVSLLRNFYRNKTHFFEFQNEKVYFAADPILFLQAGLENGNIQQLRNTRGIEINGQLGEKIYFRSMIHENQSTFLEYHERLINRNQALPGNSLYKEFDFNLNNPAFDFLNARGYAGLKVNEFLNLEIGHGRHFIGNGIRSVILSDYATNYFFTRMNTSFWKFRYQNLFTELNPFSNRVFPGGDQLLPKKYMTQHTLSFKATQRLELSVTETVMFNRENSFELQYLNPIILYRAVEHFLGSPDNVLMSGQAKWNVVDGYQVYGQVTVDEFNIGLLRDSTAWWGNKFAYQAGVKAIDFLGVSQLDVQAEINAVRPYTYTDGNAYSDEVNVSQAGFHHSSQPLAHPLGANFIEGILDIRYRIGNRLTLHPRIVFAFQGVDDVFSPDSLGYNLGANILLPSRPRAGSFNQFWLQGDRVNVSLFAINTYYEFFPNYFADLNLQYRASTSVQSEYDLNSFYFGLGIRTNFTELYRDY